MTGRWTLRRTLRRRGNTSFTLKHGSLFLINVWCNDSYYSIVATPLKGTRLAAAKVADTQDITSECVRFGGSVCV